MLFFSSFRCVIPCFASDLRNWRRAGNSTGFGGSRLWKSTKRLGLQFAAGLSPILALEFMQCLGVLDGTLSCTKEFTPRHLLQSKDWWIDWFIDLIDWLIDGVQCCYTLGHHSPSYVCILMACETSHEFRKATLLPEAAYDFAGKWSAAISVKSWMGASAEGPDPQTTVWCC